MVMAWQDARRTPYIGTGMDLGGRPWLIRDDGVKGSRT